MIWYDREMANTKVSNLFISISHFGPVPTEWNSDHESLNL